MKFRYQLISAMIAVDIPNAIDTAIPLAMPNATPMKQPTPRKRLSREQSQAQTRERLLEAARSLFVQRGFGGTSIRDIAEEAGYSQGAFYSNFPDKEALLLDLLRGHMEAEARQLATVFDSIIKDNTRPRLIQ